MTYLAYNDYLSKIISKYYLFTHTTGLINTMGEECGSNLFAIISTDSSWSKAAKIAGNIIKRSVCLTAYAIALLAAGALDLAALPYKRAAFHNKVMHTISSELSIPSPINRAKLRRQIHQFIDDETLSFKPKDKEKFVTLAMATYLRSQRIFGPVAYAWVKKLMADARRENRKLIFMARDGSAPYKMVQAINTRLSSEKIKAPVLGYFSRKVVAHAAQKAPDLFKKYISETLHIQKDEPCTFVDIGFGGSMIKNIKSLMADITKDVRFSYLVSHTEEAEGFLGDNERSIVSSLAFAGENAGVYFLEDTHQGTVISPKELKECNGEVHPDTAIPGKEKTYKSICAGEYLLRHWGQKAIVDIASQEQLTKWFDQHESITTAHKALDTFLSEIKNGKHIHLIPPS